MQEAFLALFRHLQQGRSRSNLRGWTFRVVHNLALKRRAASKQGSHTTSLSHLMESLAADPSPDPEQQVSLDRQRSKIKTVLAALSEKDRCCLTLRAEGLRYREIAGILDISLGSVALSLSRSIDRLGRAVGS